MKNKKYYFFVFILIIFIVIISSVNYVASIYKEDHSFQSSINNGDNKNIIAPTFNVANFKKDFPSEWVLLTVPFKHYKEIKFVLNWMNTLRNDTIENQKFLADILTENLQLKILPSFKKFNPDSLNMILQWAERLKIYGEADVENEMFFDVVSSFWINFISNNLSQISEEDSGIKYKFKFKYLLSKASQHGNTGSTKVSNTEKVFNYLIEKKWGYLADRFINGTSFLIKFISVLLFALVCFSFYCLYLFIKKKL